MSLEETIEKLVDAKIEKAMQGGSQTVLAEYKGMDGQGKGWVVIAGSTEATPLTRATVEASPGDTVSVTVGDGQCIMDANISNPSAGVVGVKQVAKTATEAKDDAEKAIAYSTQAATAASAAQSSADAAMLDAQDASDAAARAQATAEAVNGIAQHAQESALAAAEAASSAQESAGTAAAAAEDAIEEAASAQAAADAATRHLSDVERVVGTVNWIAEHGEYVNQAGQTFDESKVYYTRSGTAPDYVYTVVQNPVAADIASYYLLRVDESVQNYIASHLWMDNYGLNLSVDSANGYRIHQGTVDGTHAAGTYILDGSDAIVLTLNAAGEIIGKSSESHMELDYHSMQLIDKEGDAYFHVSDLRDRNGFYNAVDTWTADGDEYYFELSYEAVNSEYGVYIDGVEAVYYDPDSGTYAGVIRYIDHFAFTPISNTPSPGSIITAEYSTTSQKVKAYSFGIRGNGGKIGGFSVCEGRGNLATESYAHAEGGYTTASGTGAHAEGLETTASDWGAHAEGNSTTASGYISHAEGSGTKALAPQSHAEGLRTTADSQGGHAEGYETVAGTESETHYIVMACHAEGMGSIATAEASHAQNKMTIAASESQTALGKFNVEDANDTYAVIVGNGTADNARSNALAVDWNGNAFIAGDVKDMSGNAKYSKANMFRFEATSAACWNKLGTLETGNADSTFIQIFTGAGNNARTDQNTRIDLYIRDGWQSTPAAAGSYGAVAYVYNNTANVNVKLLANGTGGDKVDVWFYAPWAYASGFYLISGEYVSWTHSGANQSTEPSGTAQAVLVKDGRQPDTLTDYLKINTNGNIVTIGSQNASWCHFVNSANIPFYFDKDVHVKGDFYKYNGNKVSYEGHTHSYLPLAGGQMTGRLTFKDGTAMPNASTNTDFFAIGFRAFSNGGGVWYKGLSDMKSWLGISGPTNTTTASSVISLASGISLYGNPSFIIWGNVAQLTFSWSSSSAISVPASGNIGNVRIGTIVSGKRPYDRVYAKSGGDDAGAAWYTLYTGGEIDLGACEGTGAARTIAANTVFRFQATYII